MKLFKKGLRTDLGEFEYNGKRYRRTERRSLGASKKAQHEKKLKGEGRKGLFEP